MSTVVVRAYRAGLDARPGDQQRDVPERLVDGDGRLPPDVLLAQVVAVVGAHDDGGVTPQVVPVDRVLGEEAYSREKMAPILSLFTVRDEREGLELSRELLQREGTGHTAVIHTRDTEMINRFAAAMPASRILVNSPASHGVIGFTTGLMPSLTLGCGTFGGNSTTDNVSYRNLLNIKRLAHCLA